MNKKTTQVNKKGIIKKIMLMHLNTAVNKNMDHFPGLNISQILSHQFFKCINIVLENNNEKILGS